MSVGSVALYMQSCSSEVENLSDKYLDSQQANELAISYIRLTNNQYSMDLSTEETEKIKISPADLERMYREVNDEIKQ